MSINFKKYSEELKYNSYLNLKVHIDDEGNIKNAPQYKRIFGEITKDNIYDVIQKQNFQKLWKVTKQEIDVCSDCELKYMCNTSVKIEQRKNTNRYYQISECNYNPYISKWIEEDDYKTLNECGVICNEEGFSINHNKITDVNIKLWGN